jgi:hypothetical protein
MGGGLSRRSFLALAGSGLAAVELTPRSGHENVPKGSNGGQVELAASGRLPRLILGLSRLDDGPYLESRPVRPSPERRGVRYRRRSRNDGWQWCVGRGYLRRGNLGRAAAGTSEYAGPTHRSRVRSTAFGTKRRPMPRAVSKFSAMSFLVARDNVPALTSRNLW